MPDEIREPVLLQNVSREVGCALDDLQAFGRAAIASERLGHFPFRAGIEKGEFIAGLHIPDADQFHGGGIKKDGGCATVVDVLQEFRQEGDVFVCRDLDGQVGSLPMDTFRAEAGDHFTGGKRDRGVKCLLVGGMVEEDLCKVMINYKGDLILDVGCDKHMNRDFNGSEQVAVPVNVSNDI